MGCGCGNRMEATNALIYQNEIFPTKYLLSGSQLDKEPLTFNPDGICRKDDFVFFDDRELTK
jgi:hypothetical protein